MSKTYNVNNQIKARKINLVLLNGEMKESIPLTEALRIAEVEGLDVIEVSESGKSNLPVCKIVDYGKMMYNQNKKDKKQVNHIKEIKYGLNIGSHDLEIRHNKILKFLSKKYTVKYVLELHGREKGMLDSAVEVFENNLDNFKEHATWKKAQVSYGRRILISTTLFPI